MSQTISDPHYIPIGNPNVFLRYLHARRFCDREIAEILNDPKLYLLHLHSEAESPIELLYRPADSPRIWTARMVRRRRAKWHLPKTNKVRRDFTYIGETRRHARQAYARRWCNLDLDLRMTQVDILDALYEHGPQTMRQLMTRHGWSKPPRINDNYTAMGRLVSAGVVVSTYANEIGTAKATRRYSLAIGIQPVHALRRLTGIEQTLKALGCN